MVSKAAADSDDGGCRAASTNDHRVFGKIRGPSFAETSLLMRSSYPVQLPETRPLLPDERAAHPMPVPPPRTPRFGVNQTESGINHGSTGQEKTDALSVVRLKKINDP